MTTITIVATATVALPPQPHECLVPFLLLPPTLLLLLLLLLLVGCAWLVARAIPLVLRICRRRDLLRHEQPRRRGDAEARSRGVEHSRDQRGAVVSQAASQVERGGAVGVHQLVGWSAERGREEERYRVRRARTGTYNETMSTRGAEDTIRQDMTRHT
jgi:hypothetical protein